MTHQTHSIPPKVAVVIVAAGRGTRAGGGLPKQWRPLGDGSVAEATIRRFCNHPRISMIALVIHPEDRKLCETLIWDRLSKGPDLPEMAEVFGGANRDETVRRGLEALTSANPDYVLIHDVARPLVSDKVIDAVLDALTLSPGAAPALPVTDALWRGTDGKVSGTQNRDGLYRAQTPQGFHFDKILSAHRAHPGGAADDVEVARHAGLDVTIVAGEEQNLKITTPEDFARAELLLQNIT
ncbi:2-C-methyl-D-erythritol 4-phosphate cytidylyltransferase [Aliiroseovarius crassostreae]|uniref:2-C-methyl-D-erythritol 4-phosphate cytidylyltransferase n=1 Tax=Aliiroseovarius crassostreae TaxID=154981 RepID=A0A0P7KKS7_9RHOB|nr:2-C-methyl-D-erythritol 4-phosphate cytidylyltransferase [Aliiroseovarius crassostreae]KPN62509.1 hypothetical protein AKJ29_09820 [Aliiroseovarius crassostreae]SFU82110.1 2-C-methyl-D-erythritol 4-phosphate cytidylyltransferase [Aliiroseovarius crassostreae]